MSLVVMVCCTGPTETLTEAQVTRSQSELSNWARRVLQLERVFPNGSRRCALVVRDSPQAQLIVHGILVLCFHILAASFGCKVRQGSSAILTAITLRCAFRVHTFHLASGCELPFRILDCFGGGSPSIMTPGPVPPLAAMRHHNFPDESERRRNPDAELVPTCSDRWR